MAVNGSPRKKWNTATLLEKALEEAASQGALEVCLDVKKTGLNNPCMESISL